MMNDCLAGVIRRSNENVLYSYTSEPERARCSSMVVIGMGCILLEVWRSGPWERGVYGGRGVLGKHPWIRTDILFHALFYFNP